MRRLFVISDLHLGGRPDLRDDQGHVRTGYQICHAHSELAAFIRWTATQCEGRTPADLELVINGDLVDFLADDDWDGPTPWPQVWTADEGLAVRKLEQIARRARLGPHEGVFEALRDFLAGGHRLTLLLGNHDVELALPAVRRRLAEMLGDVGSRLRFIYDGEAYSVGTVLIEHGNRYDHWNMINHSALRQERSMRSRGLAVREEYRKDRYFVVPAGTHLVIHLMNLIKGRYRFIDLLKPETGTVVPLLLALEPDYRPHLRDLLAAAPVALRAATQVVRPAHLGPTFPRLAGPMADRGGGAGPPPWSGGGPVPTGPGGAPEAAAGWDASPAAPPDLRENFVPDPAATLDSVLAEVLGPDAGPFGATHAPGQGPMSWSRVAGAVDWLKARIEPLAETAESASRYFALATSRTEDQRREALHAALRHLNRDDASFDPTREHPQYLEAAREMAAAGGFEVITYGHTHLPKAIGLGPDGQGPPWYFNTGTWCDVMRLPALLTAPFADARSELEDFVRAIRQNEYGQYVFRYLTFLEIDLEPRDGTERVRRAALYSYAGPGRERSVPLTNTLSP